MINTLDKVLQGDFGDCIKTITDISYNTTNGKKFYESDFQLYCLDSIVEKHFSIQPKSADALYLSKRGIFLIEFKDGKKKNIKTDDIKLKLFEALNVLYKVVSEKSGNTIEKSEFWSQKIHYIVIYRDEDKLNSFTKRLARSAAKWGLDEYKGLYVDTALTEYDPKFVQTIFNNMTDNSCGKIKVITP
nr:hypothetical protein [uncultured Vibrio sp.]